jgi:hypothetical protein
MCSFLQRSGFDTLFVSKTLTYAFDWYEEI